MSSKIPTRQWVQKCEPCLLLAGGISLWVQETTGEWRVSENGGKHSALKLALSCPKLRIFIRPFLPHKCKEEGFIFFFLTRHLTENSYNGRELHFPLVMHCSNILRCSLLYLGFWTNTHWRLESNWQSRPEIDWGLYKKGQREGDTWITCCRAGPVAVWMCCQLWNPCSGHLWCWMPSSHLLIRLLPSSLSLGRSSPIST